MLLINFLLLPFTTLVWGNIYPHAAMITAAPSRAPRAGGNTCGYLDGNPYIARTCNSGASCIKTGLGAYAECCLTSPCVPFTRCFNEGEFETAPQSEFEQLYGSYWLGCSGSQPLCVTFLVENISAFVTMLNCDSISGRFTLLSSPAHITADMTISSAKPTLTNGPIMTSAAEVPTVNTTYESEDPTSRQINTTRGTSTTVVTTDDLPSATKPTEGINVNTAGRLMNGRVWRSQSALIILGIFLNI